MVLAKGIFNTEFYEAGLAVPSFHPTMSFRPAGEIS